MPQTIGNVLRAKAATTPVRPTLLEKTAKKSLSLPPGDLNPQVKIVGPMPEFWKRLPSKEKSSAFLTEP
jgi:hypothetical protein